ncbi:Ig-like domain-containing protein [Microbacterium album]|uniref:Fibronectin type III n=1 Tax=Microbacterium album TaxID=2053191 RepID=A0A917MLG1_9MICO|nr:Ig-like domain-containing protein [Microbacterium album]GGH42278.1 fibronectin type III [Microbacterium album]
MPQLFTALRRHRSALASGATLTAAAVVVSTLAMIYEGVATADLELDDGGVWVTKSDDLLVGHLNYPSRLLDDAVRARSPQFDVHQDGDAVLVVDSANGTLASLDVARVELATEVTLPAPGAVALGGTTIGLAVEGRLFSVPVDRISSATFTEDDALGEVGEGAGVAVSRDGSRVYAVSRASRSLLTAPAGALRDDVESADLPGVTDESELAVTAVGDTGVVLDAAAGAVLLAGRRIELPQASGGVLQHASAAHDAVYIATPSALVRQPLDGGSPEIVATVDEGVPSAPVWLNGCVYAVWSGSGVYVRDCPGEADDLTTAIDVPAEATLVLRANRRVVVVNDTMAGTVWIVDQSVERVENWDDVVPPPDSNADEEQSQDEQPHFDLPERSAENTPPTAVDDQFGVRAGRSTLLRVTDNDSDPDGDLLSARLVGSPPSGWDIAPVLGGSALQAAVPANATGTVVFAYEVDDGRGGTDQADVSVSVHGDEVNGPPQQRRVNTLQVEAGASVTYGALDGWIDPDGDDFFLAHATVEGGDEVTFRSNGVIDYRASSATPGIKEVQLTVSDGREEAVGTLRVDVRPAGAFGPVANADRVTATAGIPVTVAPLENDLSPSGEPLRLAKHDHAPGARITPDFAAGTFEFLAEAPGTYYVQYLVTDGPRSALGVVRIDVLPATSDSQPPVAVRDVALLPVGRDVLVDVLANDSDPGGGILVVQNAVAPAGGAVSVEVLEHRILRVTDLGGLLAPLTLTYTVSNGAQSATGEVLVMPVPLPETLRPPVTVDDTATVRAGDVVTIPVLANDYHPDNDMIRLEPALVETNVGADDAIFVDGDRVRFHSGGTPGTVYATYEIVDSQQNRRAGYVTIQVLPPDAGTNAAPRPKPVVARAIAGNTVRIAVPLDGIDPDGDSVELVGATSSPGKGRVTVGDSWFTYEAYRNASGRDSFTYAVRDHMGATAENTVTVGIAPPGVDNQPPYAVKDVVTVKPGRRVAVPVTVNDSDPDGDAIAIDPSRLVVPAGVEASVVGGRVLVTAPATPGEYSLTYTIADTYGATADGVLVVRVDPEAPALAPIARDDRVSPLRIGAGEQVDVAVLENDEDPDGTTDALTVRVADPDATVRRDGTVRLAVGDGPRIVRYSATDPDGETGQAFVFVPGRATLLPTLMTAEPIRIVGGQTLSIPLADHVRVRAERVPRIAVAESVRTGHSNGAPLVKDEHTLEYTAAEGYFGPDSIGVRVTDGTGPDDPEGLSAYVNIPIHVLPSENQSPTLRNASVKVAPGEEAVTVNLAKLAYDPDEDDQDRLTFSIDGAVPAGYRASVSGATLTVSADADAQPGASAALGIQVSDGTTTPGTGTITLTTVVSQRPYAVANDDVIARANQGEARRVDVLANDVNPFEGEAPLRVLGARVDSGAGTAVVDGDQVVVTPAATFTGTMIVSYRIGDATNAPEREVDGRIRLTVQGKPSAPSMPSVTSIQDRTVVLSWTPPANNGSPITGYEVTSPQGHSSSCASTTCTLDGLTNDVEYTFQVVAINEVGRSDPSPMSAPARPDARPDTPAPPTLVFGDRSVAVSWTVPGSSGSPVLGYNLEISPAPATGPIQRTGVSGTSMVWDGLENGVAYQVRVQAVNRAPDPSDWSPYSAAVVPAAPPDAPGQPTTVPASPVGAQAQIAVSWAPPANDNGDAVSSYTLTVKRGGAVVNTLTGLTTMSQNVVVDTSETDYAFSVTAHNKAGTSAPSPDSAPRRAALAPAAPASVTVTPGDGSIVVAFEPGPLNGNRADEVTYHYRVNQTGAQGTLPREGGRITGLANGSRYSVNVWATSAVQGVAPGSEAGSNEAVPFGRPIITLQGIERLDNAVRFRWHVNPNGRSLTHASHGGEGNHEHTVTGVPAGGSATLDLSVSNEAGPATARWEGRANDPPPKSASVRKTGANSFILTYTSFPPGTYLVKCWNREEYRNATTQDPRFIGTIGERSFGQNGNLELSCPTTPPGGPFSVEIQGIYWTPTITW